MKAITVKFIGATDTKPARVKATAEGGHALTITYHESEADDPYQRVARLLANKLKWSGTYFGGSIDNGNTRVYVIADSRDSFQVT